MLITVYEKKTNKLLVSMSISDCKVEGMVADGLVIKFDGEELEEENGG